MKEINLLFTDLDETLLDENYRFRESALECIRIAYFKNFVIIFTSSKTVEEQKYFALKLGIPVIYTVENGAAIYIPENIFSKKPAKNRCRKIVLSSLSITYIEETLYKLQNEYPHIKFYGNSSLEEIEKFTNLPPSLANLAKKREYTETIFKGYSKELENQLLEKGIFPQKGSRFVTVGDKTDKGKAAVKLISLLKKSGYKILRTIGIGDGENDIPLLKTVNEPYIVGDKISLNGAYKIKSLCEISI